MSEDNKNQKKPHVNIGTIGSTDHGKTVLTAAIAMTMSKIHKDSNLPIIPIDDQHSYEKAVNDASIKEEKGSFLLKRLLETLASHEKMSLEDYVIKLVTDYEKSKSEDQKIHQDFLNELESNIEAKKKIIENYPDNFIARKMGKGKNPWDKKKYK